MKKKIAILSAIFVLFFVIGLWFNMTPGKFLGGDFWKLKDGAYTRWGDSIRHDGGAFEMNIGGRELTAELSETEEGYRVDFSDGWAVELESLAAHIQVQVGGVLLGGNSTYILTDMDSESLRFGRVMEEVSEPFYDENGNAVGESRYYMTESGESVGWQEVWYDKPEWSTPEAETIQLYEGIQLQYEDFNRNLFVNEDGEYLMNAQDLPMMRWSDSTTWYSRNAVASYLVRIAHGETGRRGHIGAVLLYAFIYLLGAVQFLWPQELAFFGHRWKFETEPELSDAGLFMMQLGAVLAMAMGVVVLFIGT